MFIIFHEMHTKTKMYFNNILKQTLYNKIYTLSKENQDF